MEFLNVEPTLNQLPVKGLPEWVFQKSYDNYSSEDCKSLFLGSKTDILKEIDSTPDDAPYKFFFGANVPSASLIALPSDIFNALDFSFRDSELRGDCAFGFKVSENTYVYFPMEIFEWDFKNAQIGLVISEWLYSKCLKISDNEKVAFINLLQAVVSKSKLFKQTVYIDDNTLRNDVTIQGWKTKLMSSNSYEVIGDYELNLAPRYF